MVQNKFKSFQPKTEIQTRHKVICFGTVVHAENEEEQRLYKFYHQRADLKVTEGFIPIGFYSKMVLNEGHPIYLQTRYGGFDVDVPVGPQYMVTWLAEKEIVPPLMAGSDGWVSNLDELWSSVLAYFERKDLLQEDSLDFLDADPFVLFGIDDQVTQQALEKLERFPALLCEGASPNFDEWAYYLRIDPYDTRLKWLVRAFQETDLPRPWTSYKGVGSIVCYIRSDSGQITWKHPFYDYFRQLREFCKQATPEEVMQVRCNRLLWTYEATSSETNSEQEPLISPDYVERLAEIFGYDVKVHGCIVRNCKAQMKAMGKQYREKQDISLQQTIDCKELLELDAQKYDFMCDHWTNKFNDEIRFDLTELANGQVVCVNCLKTGMCFCLECKDYLCIACYELLHNKGARMYHSPFRLVPCCLCITQPAKLHCTFTDKSLCHQCYALKHIRQLPADGKENQPRRIDYVHQYSRFAQMAKEGRKKKVIPTLDIANNLRVASGDEEDYETVLSHDWHPFYDARGVKFYHNFATNERMRQSPRRVPNTADPGAPAVKDITASLSDEGREQYLVAAQELGKTDVAASEAAMRFAGGVIRNKKEGLPRPLSGFDSLETEPAYVKAAEMPELRSLRPPHRVHIPNEEKPF